MELLSLYEDMDIFCDVSGKVEHGGVCVMGLDVLKLSIEVVAGVVGAEDEDAWLSC